jgi:protein-disulfide isomerase
MKIQNWAKIVSLIVTLFFISCKGEKSSRTNSIDEPIAIVNQDKIYMSDIDKGINKKLYDVLFQVYLIRKNALEEKINQKIIENEAAKEQLSADAFLNKVVYNNVNDVTLQKFSQECKYDKTGIPVISNTLEYFDVNSVRGQMLLRDKYKQFLLGKFIDKNKNKYQVKSNLIPPQSPLIDMAGVNAVFKGNNKSKITVWILTDLENNNCKPINTIFDNLYNKYNKEIRFAFVNFSGDVTHSATALECARKQNRFWEMYSQLSVISTKPSDKDIFSIADGIGLNKEKFIKDYKDSTICYSIIKNINQLHDKGFWGVPSIVINNHIILDVFSQNEIEKAIEIELSKNK